MIQINLDNPVFKSYLTYVCLLILKTILMSTLTGLTRMRKKAFCSPEDAKAFSRIFPSAVVKLDDEDVERTRRAHLNDLENIPLFIFAGFIYLLTKPDETIAINLFRIFTLCRFLHTLVYAIFVTPQPTRAICWTVSYLITIYMTIKSFLYFFYV